MNIEIKKSRRRKKTVSARMDGDKMVVLAPMQISDGELNKIIDNFKKRFEDNKRRVHLNKNENLRPIADELNNKYFNGMAKCASIRYVTNQNSRFGSCSTTNGTIRISDKLASLPKWVRDYVIIHELAHLLVPNHGNKFWQLVHRYPLAERAIGYLMALGYNEDYGEE